LQKHEGWKYQSKTRGKTTTLKGSKEVLAIGGTRMVSKRSSVEEEQEEE
jgi:hypothetical protein